MDSLDLKRINRKMADLSLPPKPPTGLPPSSAMLSGNTLPGGSGHGFSMAKGPAAGMASTSVSKAPPTPNTTPTSLPKPAVPPSEPTSAAPSGPGGFLSGLIPQNAGQAATHPLFGQAVQGVMGSGPGMLGFMGLNEMLQGHGTDRMQTLTSGQKTAEVKQRVKNDFAKKAISWGDFGITDPQTQQTLTQAGMYGGIGAGVGGAAMGLPALFSGKKKKDVLNSTLQGGLMGGLGGSALGGLSAMSSTEAPTKLDATQQYLKNYNDTDRTYSNEVFGNNKNTLERAGGVAGLAGNALQHPELSIPQAWEGSKQLQRDHPFISGLTPGLNAYQGPAIISNMYDDIGKDIRNPLANFVQNLGTYLPSLGGGPQQ